MPLYDYACTKCGHVQEVRHGFNESYDRPCEACGAPIRRVFNPAPVLFKGSGFYVTDSRSSGASKPEKRKETADGGKPETPSSADVKPAGEVKEKAKPTDSAA